MTCIWKMHHFRTTQTRLLNFTRASDISGNELFYVRTVALLQRVGATYLVNLCFNVEVCTCPCCWKCSRRMHRARVLSPVVTIVFFVDVDYNSFRVLYYRYTAQVFRIRFTQKNLDQLTNFSDY